jgi:hypothetical protein
LEYEEFESDLGDIAISKRHIEREDSDNHWIEERKEREGADKLLEAVDFAKIEDLEYEIGSVLHSINIQVEDDWKKLYFVSEETAQEVMDSLEYRLKVFRQNYD